MGDRLILVWTLATVLTISWRQLEDKYEGSFRWTFAPLVNALVVDIWAMFLLWKWTVS